MPRRYKRVVGGPDYVTYTLNKCLNEYEVEHQHWQMVD